MNDCHGHHRADRSAAPLNLLKARKRSDEGSAVGSLTSLDASLAIDIARYSAQQYGKLLNREQDDQVADILGIGN